MKKVIILLIIILSGSEIAKGQYFQTGQDPSNIRWHQINTANFQVIFPEEFEKQAQIFSSVLEKVYQFGSKTLNHSPRRISVVLHTRTVKSNGLLAWAPKRIELFTTPHQQIYAQDWMEQLALHEFRHLVQLDKIQSEMPFLLKAILGEQAAALVVGAYLPFWFLEGDAVVTETALSRNGRGRMASFSMEHRAQLTELGKYSFDKAWMGSYKDFVPNHYKLGYWLVGKTREKYGPEIWKDALTKIGNHPFSVTPFNSTIRKYTGMSIAQLYSEIFEELGTTWKHDIDKRQIDSVEIISPERKQYTEYLYPEFYRDSLIIAYRTSLDDIGRFVIIDSKRTEQIVFTPGFIFEESVSLSGEMLIWAERQADLRWTHSDRSVVCILNVENRKLREIKSENKLFSPVISPDLSSFAAVEVDPENQFFLSVFNLETGELVKRFSSAENSYFFTPCWDETGKTLYTIGLSSTGKYLAAFDLQAGTMQQLTDNTFSNIKNPVYNNGKIIFSSDFSGVDNLYQLDIQTKQITEVVSARFGADYPTVSRSGNQLVFSNYNSKGFNLAAINLREDIYKNENITLNLREDKLSEKLASHENGIPDFSNADTINYPVKKYFKIGHLFNFHSWAPAYVDVNSTEIRPGFSLFSQNKLGTAETRLGYDYNVSDRTGRYKISFLYSGLFPEFNTELSVGNEASNYYQVINTVDRYNQIISSDTLVKRFTWKEIKADFDVRIPLNLSRGKYSKMLYPEVKYTFNQISHHASTPEEFYSGNYHALAYRLYYYNLLRQSSQNLMSKWGQVFDLIYRHTPFIGNDLGTLAGAQSILYFPGLFKNDGLKVYQGYQEKMFTKNHNFSNFVRSPRGFQGYQNNRMYSIAIDYKFPMWYPDLSIGKFAYLKRLKTSLFYDYAWISAPTIDTNGIIYPNNKQFDLKSIGMELTSDLHVLRLFAPIELGVRSVYRPEIQDFRFDLLFTVDFNGF